MTKTTEELKREMYQFLKILRVNSGRPNLADIFESALEAYLEALRKESTHQQSRLELVESLANGFAEQVDTANKINSSLINQRDELRNKLQAFEFANKSAGEFLQAAQAKVKAQRQSIGQLKNDRNNAQALAAVNYQKYQKARQELSELRKSLKAVPAQDSKENAKREPYIEYRSDLVMVPPCSHADYHKNYIGYCPHCGA